MAKVVGFISEKGGVGKTTACYHLAVALQRYHYKKILVVDTDYQRGGITCRFVPSMLESFRTGRIEGGSTLFDKYQQLYSDTIFNATVKLLPVFENNIDLLPADPRLSQVAVEKMPASNNIKENNRRLYKHLSVLRDVLSQFYTKFDYILIDSHPELSDLLRSVVFACDYCVSPVKLDLQSTIGVPSAMQCIQEVNEDMNMIQSALDEIPKYQPTFFAGAIGMMAREWGGILKSTERTEFLRLQRTGEVFDTYITEGDGLRQAAENRCPVYDISGPNADKQSGQFKNLTEEFLKRCP
ncbi:MAG: ParA family protein [Candidatus Electrothrix aestuarii]|uniref:ParA family protein n=1 Tax=Candidatus Electrothrix aestuarii TaxID=3062594 RepID=A0AAU8LQQ8_9BACT|nr:ParA family protein [Candidatus Electrothrix aestuarii]